MAERAPPPLPLLRPAALVELLEELESQTPSLSALPPPEGSTSWGTYFVDGQHEGSDEDEDAELGESKRDVRLRIMTAIGNCHSLRTIDLNPKARRGRYIVREEEATAALLNGLKRNNPAVERLELLWFKGFGTPEACKALAAAVVRPSSSRLKLLDMRGLELSVEGVGQISAALRDNSASLLRVLYLHDNDRIGNAAGARHIAAILTHSPALRTLGLSGIGMDDAGAVLIADAVIRTTTLHRLDIGYDREKNPEQAVMLIPLLTALTRDASSSSESQSHSSRAAASTNETITQLRLQVTGLPGGKDKDSAVEAAGLAEAVAAMIASNTTLKLLRVSSFFVTRGLWALPQNSSITTLQLVHQHSLDEEELDPLLLSILHKCTKLERLDLIFQKPYGASDFTKVLFQGLKHNKPCVKSLVLDGLHGLDDHMFQDLIQSLSTNTNLDHISIRGSSWGKQGKAQRLAEALRDTRLQLLPPRLLALLAELESEPPALQQLPSEDLWGSYFDCQCLDEECQHRGEWQWELRLRLLTAIGKCRTLRDIQLSPLGQVGYSVRQVEALALLSGLQDNLVLQQLDLCGYMGFGTAPACCQALAAVIERFCSLKVLDLQDVGLSAEGVGNMAAALGRNGSSVLSSLALDGNDIGNVVGAQHLAHILTNSPSLRGLGISSIGLEEEGAAVIAQALAHTTTLTWLRMGELKPQKPRQSAFMIPLLQVLVWPESDTGDTSQDLASGPINEEEEEDYLDYYDFWSGLKKWSETSKHYFTDTTQSAAAMSSSRWYSPGRGVTGTPDHDAATSLHQPAQNPPPVFFNRSITELVLECPGGQEAVEPGLGEALARVLRSNRVLNELNLCSFFITRGLAALRESSSITKLHVRHTWHSDDDDMDPVLITILEECKTVEEIRLQFEEPFGPSEFTKAFFRGLRNNCSIKRLVLDGWDGLDDHMFHDLMRSLRHNPTNVLESISIEGTSWEGEGKAKHIQNALIQNKSMRTTSSAGRQGSEEGASPGSEEVPSQIMAPMAVRVYQDPELLALLSQLESPPPTLGRLPGVKAFGHLFNKDAGHSKEEQELRLRLMTAIGKCRTLASIQLNPVRGRNYSRVTVAEGTAQLINGDGAMDACHTRGIYRATAAEATALLEGLTSNPVLEILDLLGYDGFGTGEVCHALATTLQSSSTLQWLDMRYTGVTADGLGCIAAALRTNPRTMLRVLNLSGNPNIGAGAGAGHLADILTSTPTLSFLGISDIGMDDAGAVMIGNALAQSPTLHFLDLGYHQVWSPEQAGTTATLLARALTPSMADTEQEPQAIAATPPSAHDSITELELEVWGAGQQPVSAALEEAVHRMLRFSRTLNHLCISSCFISRGLEGLCDNSASSIIRVTIRHGDSSDSEDYCKLMPILQRCPKVEWLRVRQVSVGSCNLSRMFFKSLQNNPHLKELVLDNWEGLDDDMFQGLMQALQVNTNLEKVSFEDTIWKRQGKGGTVDEILRQNKEYRRALAGVPTMPVKSCRLVLCGFPYAGKTTILNTLMESQGNYVEVMGRISVWDLAGHKEYHALHDFVFPSRSNSSLFLCIIHSSLRPIQICM